MNDRLWGYWLGVVTGALGALVTVLVIAQSNFPVLLLIGIGVLIALMVISALWIREGREKEKG